MSVLRSGSFVADLGDGGRDDPQTGILGSSVELHELELNSALASLIVEVKTDNLTVGNTVEDDNSVVALRSNLKPSPN